MSGTEAEMIEELDDEVEVKEEEIIEDFKPSTSGSVLFPTETKFSNIKNKHVRIQKFQKAKKEQKKAKKEAKKKLLQEGAPKKVPHTIESLRIKDETTVTNLEDEANELIRDDLEKDEFNEYYKQSYEPKVLITYADNPMRKTRIFGRELTRIIPNSISLYRNRSGVKKIVRSAIEKEYTDILVINENRKEPDGLLVIHLPNGPTAHFKISNVRITTELRKNHKDITAHRPEVILNNFTTRLGLSVGRMLGALFHYDPEFVGQRAVTFHNQRDYIFFRHYRYGFANMWTNILIILVTFSCFKAEPCLVTEFDQISSFTLNCKNITIENLTVPGGETLKLNLTDGATVIFKGKTVFEFYLWKGPLVTINGTAVTVEGDEGHVFDGRGEEYWDGLGDWGVTKPQFFTVQTFGGSIMRNIYVLNSPHDVLQVTNSDSVTYSNWYINNTAGDEGVAPEGKFAKNTDAFDVWNSTNVIIEDSVVYNQDDCIAVRCGANINVNNLECHGTHGLSISVGFNNDTTAINPLNVLTNVTFANSTLFGGENAIHIKTHNEGGYGFIENVTYENIQLKGPSRYGILIEENYPNHGEPSDNIPIRNLLISNVKGEVEPEAVAVSVVCAENGCKNWFWSGIEITGSQKNSTCNFQPSGSFIC